MLVVVMPWPAALALALVTTLLVSASALVAWSRFWARRLRYDVRFDDTAWLDADDGGRVRLGRLRARGGASPLPPVVMCHGLAMNGRTFALDPAESLARRLADEGRDVWLVELRGASRRGQHGATAAHNFDTYAQQDVPAVLARVCAETGAERVDWVGFSMGGMLAYAWLGALGGGRIRRLVTLGSPVAFGRYRRSPLRAAHRAVRLALGLLRFTPFRSLLAAVAPLVSRHTPPALTPSFRGERYASVWLRRVLVNTFGDAPAGVTQQFVDWIATGRWTSAEGALDYEAGLAAITVPLCVIAGDRDRLAPPSASLLAAERAGASETRTVVIGPESGAEGHYDHLDLLFGRRAGRDVFPYVLEWLGR